MIIKKQINSYSKGNIIYKQLCVWFGWCTTRSKNVVAQKLGHRARLYHEESENFQYIYVYL